VDGRRDCLSCLLMPEAFRILAKGRLWGPTDDRGAEPLIPTSSVWKLALPSPLPIRRPHARGAALCCIPADVGQSQLQNGRSGLLTATASIVGQGEADLALQRQPVLLPISAMKRFGLQRGNHAEWRRTLPGQLNPGQSSMLSSSQSVVRPFAGAISGVLACRRIGAALIRDRRYACCCLMQAQALECQSRRRTLPKPHGDIRRACGARDLVYGRTPQRAGSIVFFELLRVGQHIS